MTEYYLKQIAESLYVLKLLAQWVFWPAVIFIALCLFGANHD